ncbi:P-loop containing nucleoside triphosphate hydrolase protein [Halteromyces radiatus]|uniref:P-loop containing nucleoside triphosphate hydrolase protein n=1 Tax=Halteromyces radiatus TaxID=101107 RepID=UPI00221F2970|nr:P-loop containing nucleoside triphosphate hydrolase protein [Halteromyces radiatus]KAI8086045.1 P-loop containing nucleoside triphosphate hydrolase protein [Halteromyces radiatus]
MPPKLLGTSLLLTPSYSSLLFRNAQVYYRGFSSLPPPLPPTSTDATSIGGMISTVAEKLGVGELATGGLQLAVIGGLIASVRYFGGFVIEFMTKKTVATAQFDSTDESFSWILNWLSEHPFIEKTTHFTVSTTITRAGQRLTGEGLDALQPPVYFLPAHGMVHFFTYKNRLLWLTRERPQSSTGAPAVSGNAIMERIQISTIGRSRTILQSLVLEAQKKFIERDQSRTVVFAADQYGAWRRTRSRPKRPLSTIVIPSNVKQQLVLDTKEFLASEQWYSDRGIPYRRGLLLYGEPGSGKTSFVYSLAGELGINIYVVALSNKGLTDDVLTELLSETPSRCILLIEDVDAAFVQRTRGEGTVGNNVTFSGLLNAIDGVSAQEGRILCMTTNHPEKLDPALIRPGRIDVKIHFGNATKQQAEELFIKFYPHLESDYIKSLASQFASKIPDNVFSMAHLQGFLMIHKKQPEQALYKVDEWLLKHDRSTEENQQNSSDVENMDAAIASSSSTSISSLS